MLDDLMAARILDFDIAGAHIRFGSRVRCRLNRFSISTFQNSPSAKIFRFQRRTFSSTVREYAMDSSKSVIGIFLK